MQISLPIALFYGFAAFTLVCALGVAVSTSIVYSAFALLGTLPLGGEETTQSHAAQRVCGVGHRDT